MDDLQMESYEVEAAQPWIFDYPETIPMGPSDDREIAKDIRIQIGNKPLVRNLRDLASLKGMELPPDRSVLTGGLYLITHSIGVLSKRSESRIKMIRYECIVDDPATTVDLFPSTQFKESFRTAVTFEGGLSANGHAKSPDAVGGLSGQVEGLGGGAQIRLGASAESIGVLQFKVITSLVQAIGQASTSPMWQFRRAGTPLVGDQIMIQTILVRPGTAKLTVTMRGIVIVQPQWLGKEVALNTKDISTVLDLK